MNPFVSSIALWPVINLWFKESNRSKEIFQKINKEKWSFVINQENFKNLSLDIAEDLIGNFKRIDSSISLKWCLSTVKKAKVFTLIYQDCVSFYKEL